MRKTKFLTVGCILAMSLSMIGCSEKSSDNKTESTKQIESSSTPTSTEDSSKVEDSSIDSEIEPTTEPNTEPTIVAPVDIQALLDAAVIKGATADDPTIVESYQNDALGIGFIDGMKDSYYPYFNTKCITDSLKLVSEYYTCLQKGDWQGAFNLQYPDGTDSLPNVFINADDYKNFYNGVSFNEAIGFKYILSPEHFDGDSMRHCIYDEGQVEVSYGTGTINIGWSYYDTVGATLKNEVPMVEGHLKVVNDGETLTNGFSVKLDGNVCKDNHDADYRCIFYIAERPEYTVVVNKDDKDYTFTVSLEEMKASEGDGCLTLDISKI